MVRPPSRSSPHGLWRRLVARAGRGRSPHPPFPLAAAAGWAPSSGFVLLLPRYLPSRASLASVLIVAPLLAADLRLNNGPNESTALPPSRFDILDPDTKNETILMLKRLLAKPLPSDRRDRVELLGVGFEWPNAPMIHGFDHTLGYNPLRLPGGPGPTRAAAHHP